MINNTYQQEKNKKYTEKIRELEKELPMVCTSFLRSLENYTSILTRYAYAVDLKGFFTYLVTESDILMGRSLKEISGEDIANITVNHIEDYLDYETFYYKDDKEITNGERGKARKLSSLRTFFKYCYKKEIVKSNVCSLIETPKLHEQAIIRLEPNEVATLLDYVDNGDGLSERQKKYHLTTRTRDIAILTLLLGTGIRISELVGIDVNDINFEDNSFLVTRKGGKQSMLAFGDEVASALLDYKSIRDTVIPMDGHEEAFFLSLQQRRITVRAVENLVKKYASIVTPNKHITPHKLRSTYGTMLYRETQDIYLVADVLGHKDVNTTRKHYAAQQEDHVRKAAKSIHLRDE